MIAITTNNSMSVKPRRVTGTTSCLVRYTQPKLPPADTSLLRPLEITSFRTRRQPLCHRDVFGLRQRLFSSRSHQQHALLGSETPQLAQLVARGKVAGDEAMVTLIMMVTGLAARNSHSETVAVPRVPLGVPKLHPADFSAPSWAAALPALLTRVSALLGSSGQASRLLLTREEFRQGPQTSTSGCGGGSPALQAAIRCVTLSA